MAPHLLIAFALFTAALLAGSAISDLIGRLEGPSPANVSMTMAIAPGIPLILAPLWAGWRAKSLAEVALFWPCGALAYLTFCALTGQLFSDWDPIDGGALLLFNTAVLPFGAVLLGAAGWIAQLMWHRMCSHH